MRLDKNEFKKLLTTKESLISETATDLIFTTDNITNYHIYDNVAIFKRVDTLNIYDDVYLVHIF
jgi:hypothetical protein